MQKSLVFTIIGPDRPGVVERISECVSDRQCNWLGSRMSRLGGKFAGMVQVEGAEEKLRELRNDLAQMSGLTVVVESGGGFEEENTRTFHVTILGLDRPGIVHEVFAALASGGMNVLNLETEVSRAAMTGRLMFHGEAVVELGESQELEQVSERLDEISRNLGIDIELSEED